MRTNSNSTNNSSNKLIPPPPTPPPTVTFDIVFTWPNFTGVKNIPPIYQNIIDMIKSNNPSNVPKDRLIPIPVYTDSDLPTPGSKWYLTQCGFHLVREATSPGFNVSWSPTQNATGWRIKKTGKDGYINDPFYFDSDRKAKERYIIEPFPLDSLVQLQDNQNELPSYCLKAGESDYDENKGMKSFLVVAPTCTNNTWAINDKGRGDAPSSYRLHTITSEDWVPHGSDYKPLTQKASLIVDYSVWGYQWCRYLPYFYSIDKSASANIPDPHPTTKSGLIQINGCLNVEASRGHIKSAVCSGNLPAAISAWDPALFIHLFTIEPRPTHEVTVNLNVYGAFSDQKFSKPSYDQYNNIFNRITKDTGNTGNVLEACQTAGLINNCVARCRANPFIPITVGLARGDRLWGLKQNVANCPSLTQSPALAIYGAPVLTQTNQTVDFNTVGDDSCTNVTCQNDDAANMYRASYACVNSSPSVYGSFIPQYTAQCSYSLKQIFPKNCNDLANLQNKIYEDKDRHDKAINVKNSDSQDIVKDFCWSTTDYPGSSSAQSTSEAGKEKSYRPNVLLCASCNPTYDPRNGGDDVRLDDAEREREKEERGLPHKLKLRPPPKRLDGDNIIYQENLKNWCLGWNRQTKYFRTLDDSGNISKKAQEYEIIKDIYEENGEWRTASDSEESARNNCKWITTVKADGNHKKVCVVDDIKKICTFMKGKGGCDCWNDVNGTTACTQRSGACDRSTKLMNTIDNMNTQISGVGFGVANYYCYLASCQRKVGDIGNSKSTGGARCKNTQTCPNSPDNMWNLSNLMYRGKDDCKTGYGCFNIVNIGEEQINIVGDVRIIQDGCKPTNNTNNTNKPNKPTNKPTNVIAKLGTLIRKPIVYVPLILIFFASLVLLYLTP
jgi:hypothetical protein